MVSFYQPCCLISQVFWFCSTFKHCIMDQCCEIVQSRVHWLPAIRHGNGHSHFLMRYYLTSSVKSHFFEITSPVHIRQTPPYRPWFSQDFLHVSDYRKRVLNIGRVFRTLWIATWDSQGWGFQTPSRSCFLRFHMVSCSWMKTYEILCSKWFQFESSIHVGFNTIQDSELVVS